MRLRGFPLENMAAQGFSLRSYGSVMPRPARLDFSQR